MASVATQDALGLMLLEEGLITQAQLYDGILAQRKNNRLLGTCLMQLGHVDAETLLAAQSRLLDLPALPPGLLTQAAPEALARVPAAMALRLRIVPYSWDGSVLGVALCDDRVLPH